MPGNLKQMFASLRPIWQRFRKQWVEEVPEDIAICEFDCRKGQCLYDEWATCERRISKAGGELMPSPPDMPPAQKPGP